MQISCADAHFLWNRSALRVSFDVYLPVSDLRYAQKCLVSEIGPLKVVQTSAQLYNNCNLALSWKDSGRTPC